MLPGLVWKRHSIIWLKHSGDVLANGDRWWTAVGYRAKHGPQYATAHLAGLPAGRDLTLLRPVHSGLRPVFSVRTFTFFAGPHSLSAGAAARLRAVHTK